MKRFIRIFLITAAVCMVSGILLAGCGTIIGRRQAAENIPSVRETFRERVAQTPWGSWLVDVSEDMLSGGRGGKDSEPSDRTGASGAGQTGAVKGLETADGGTFDMSLAGRYRIDELKKLEIHAEGVGLMIEEGETGGEILVSRSSDRVIVKDNISKNGLKLTIRRESRLVSMSEEKVRVIIPAGCSFEEFELEAEACEADVCRLASEKMKISAAAASVKIEYAEAEKLEMETSAGSVEVLGGQTDALTAECSVGSLLFSGGVEKSLEADCQVGNIEIEVYGQKEDFDYEIDREAMGALTIDGEDQSGIARKNQEIRYGGSSKTAKLNCEMGNVNITFAEPQNDRRAGVPAGMEGSSGAAG